MLPLARFASHLLQCSKEGHHLNTRPWRRCYCQNRRVLCESCFGHEYIFNFDRGEVPHSLLSKQCPCVLFFLTHDLSDFLKLQTLLQHELFIINYSRSVPVTHRSLLLHWSLTKHFKQRVEFFQGIMQVSFVAYA